MPEDLAYLLHNLNIFFSYWERFEPETEVSALYHKMRILAIEKIRKIIMNIGL